jgi:predicted secreted protein
MLQIGASFIINSLIDLWRESIFTDTRSKKVILVAHCILNQNAKIDRCAYYPGAMREVTQTLMDAGIGFIQMPCPELLHLGLDRQVERNIGTTIESEDDRVATLMNSDHAKRLCRRIAKDFNYQIKQYLLNGFTVIGILGINGSPTCGVETAWSDGIEINQKGVLISAIFEEFTRQGINLTIRGIKAKTPQEALGTVMELINSSNAN